MKHTPAPWKIHKNIGKKGELGIVADAAPCIIAVMGNQREWPEEAEANARLIAAAPELLAALIAVMPILLHNRPDGQIYADARAAIAKASEGRIT